jgi:hypothetical protein
MLSFLPLYDLGWTNEDFVGAYLRLIGSAVKACYALLQDGLLMRIAGWSSGACSCIDISE